MTNKIKSGEKWEEELENRIREVLSYETEDGGQPGYYLKENQFRELFALFHFSFHSQKLQLLDKIEKWARENKGKTYKLPNKYIDGGNKKLDDLLNLIKEMGEEK